MRTILTIGGIAAIFFAIAACQPKATYTGESGYIHKCHRIYAGVNQVADTYTVSRQDRSVAIAKSVEHWYYSTFAISKHMPAPYQIMGRTPPPGAEESRKQQQAVTADEVAKAYKVCARGRTW